MRGKKVAPLRRDGRLPGVVYGAGRRITGDLARPARVRVAPPPHRTQCRGRPDRAGDGKVQPVLLQAIQDHPVGRQPIHVDLLAVNLEEETTVDVAVVADRRVTRHRQAGRRPASPARLGRACAPSRTICLQAIELDVTPLDTFEAVLHALRPEHPCRRDAGDRRQRGDRARPAAAGRGRGRSRFRPGRRARRCRRGRGRGRGGLLAESGVTRRAERGLVDPLCRVLAASSLPRRPTTSYGTGLRIPRVCASSAISEMADGRGNRARLTCVQTLRAEIPLLCAKRSGDNLSC